VGGLGVAFTLWTSRLMPEEPKRTFAGLWGATMVIPTIAVVAQGYTGLIYTVELLVGLLAALALSTRKSVRGWLDDSFMRKVRVSS
jgi:hypothetical protein